MDGDFKGDFSRDSFTRMQISGQDGSQIVQQPFSQLLMQQGRVQLDADWNENNQSILYYLRTLAADVIGPVGGRGHAFEIELIDGTNGDKDFKIGRGHYYVDGILCVNEAVDKDGQTIDAPLYSQQPYNPTGFVNAAPTDGKYLVYLDVWERQVTALENDDIREVALGQGGPDTATRGQIVWQVRLLLLQGKADKALTSFIDDIQGATANKADNLVKLKVDLKDRLTDYLQSDGRGYLVASLAGTTAASPDPCIIAPDAKYRGEENLLYRVEIHTGGTPVESASAAQTKGAGQRGRKKNAAVSAAQGPTFKWSRENGSVVFAVLDTTIQASSAGSTITLSLENLGRDGSRYTLKKDDWVELVTPDTSLKQAPGQLFQVVSVDYSEMQVVLRVAGAWTIEGDKPSRFFLRRWDYRGGSGRSGLTIAQDGAALIIEDESRPLDLENGIQVIFRRLTPATDGSAAYRTGDYWLIPARATTGTILWPSDGDTSLALLPHGIKHHYAPLSRFTVSGGKITPDAKSDINLRSTFRWLTEIL